MVLARIESRYTYHPERAIPLDLSEFEQEQIELQGDSFKICARYKRLSDERIILFSHGNASSIEGISETYKFFHTLGFSYFAYDYPGYGNSTGKPSEKALYLSFDLAYQEVIRRGYRPEQIVLYGVSLGGAVSVEGATKVEAAALIIESSFTSTAGMARVFFPYFPPFWFVTNAYRSIDKISEINKPVFIVHGDQDETTPLKFGEALYERARNPKFLYVIKNAGHRNQRETGGQEYIEKFKKFITEFRI